MSLLSNIPGLSAHETPIPPVVISFNNAAAQDVIRNVITEVAGTFTMAAWSWLIANRADVISCLKRLGNDLNLTYLAQDMTKVKDAADLFLRAHLKAWEIFEKRPPIIEVQESLL